MKKLKNKVFLTIFIILTLFISFILISSTLKSYYERRDTIFNIIRNIPINMDVPMRRDNSDDLERKKIPNDNINDVRRIYLDFNVYTVILDENNKYQGVVNHTEDEDFDDTNIQKITEEILTKYQKDGEKVYIGNLYTNQYSYVVTNNNTLIIMDNANTNAILKSGLMNNIILFIFGEIIIFILTYYLTNWIITPVKKTFEKQKEFIADASHELKTPLSVMIASCDAYFNDKDEKWVINMKNESERMIKLVTELLDLAKTEKEQEIMMGTNDLSSIVESSILTFESVFFDKKIKLKYKIEPGISFTCNPDLIQELLGILIDNSITHCSLNGKVFIDLYQKNKQIILEVKNSGLPIKKEDEEKIFERFYKVDTSRNRNSNHYGLGLAIAKNIVIKHKGEISAHSTNGYTTFKIVWNQK